MEKALLTVSEAARRLSLGRATAYRLVQTGELPSVRVGRAVRVPVRALDAWVSARTSGGAGLGLMEESEPHFPERRTPASLRSPASPLDGSG